MDLPGFYYFKNIIDKELSDNIIKYLNNQEWKGISASENGRKVQQYGFEYNYITRGDSEYKKIQDIPEILMNLQKIALNTVKEVVSEEIFNESKLNQCIVNKYEPKQGISAHIDKISFGPVIACFTLGSGTTMTFTTIRNKEKITIEKYVESNSLYIMSDESRYSWMHEIKPRVADDGVRRGTRISVTFRSVNE